MPAIDQCEPAIVRALQRAGWLVTHQPYAIKTDRARSGVVFGDLRLQRNISDADAIVVVEVKCFADDKVFWSELYRAIGQYVVYRSALRLNQLSYPVYLALPVAAYRQHFRHDLLQSVIDDLSMNLIVVDLETEEIAQWMTSNE